MFISVRIDMLTDYTIVRMNSTDTALLMNPLHKIPFFFFLWNSKIVKSIWDVYLGDKGIRKNKKLLWKSVKWLPLREQRVSYHWEGTYGVF